MVYDGTHAHALHTALRTSSPDRAFLAYDLARVVWDICERSHPGVVPSRAIPIMADWLHRTSVMFLRDAWLGGTRQVSHPTAETLATVWYEYWLSEMREEGL